MTNSEFFARFAVLGALCVPRPGRKKNEQCDNLPMTNSEFFARFASSNLGAEAVEEEKQKEKQKEKGGSGSESRCELIGGFVAWASR